MNLAVWLDRKKVQRAKFAHLVGVHPITVSKWCSGLWMPRSELLTRITEATEGDVTANDFLAAVVSRQQAAIENKAA